MNFISDDWGLEFFRMKRVLNMLPASPMRNVYHFVGVLLQLISVKATPILKNDQKPGSMPGLNAALGTSYWANSRCDERKLFYETTFVELGGSVITFLENISLAEDIISTLRKARVIPQNAKVLDFPERETKSSNATPWIATFKGESAVHPDILYNVSVGRTGTTLVYIVECEKLIEYRIFGRKKNVILPTDTYHVEKLNSPGSWLSFPSIHYHYGSGPKRTIISLTYVQHEETGEEKLKKNT